MRTIFSITAVIITGFAILLMVGGCTNIKHAPLDIQYYTLEYDPPRPVNASPLPHVLKIEQFQTSPLYDSNRIILRREDFTRDEYTYHKWQARPGELVSFFLARDFSETGRFQATLYSESNLSYQYLISGMVEEFYLQTGNSSEAFLALVVNLIDRMPSSGSSAILMQKKYRAMVETPKEGPQGLAMAMSTAMQQVSIEILEDVSDLIRKQSP